MKELFDKIWEFFIGIWRFLIGLYPSESQKTLSSNDRRLFFDGLGYAPFSFFCILWVILFFVNIAMDGSLGGIIIISVVVVVSFWILKLIWEIGPVVTSEREAEGCKFIKEERNGVIHGFITYNGHIYGVENFLLDGDGELIELIARISSDKKSGRFVRVYYDEKTHTFIERTEVNDGVYKSYEIVSWLFFAVSLSMILFLFIGALIIIL